MNALLQEILSSNSVKDEQGNSIDLHSSISIEEADFISKMVADHHLTKAVEIGCAMGISSLAIADALGKSENSAHYILDPNQKSQWNNIGVNNLRKAGYSNFKLIEDYSELALPEMVRQGIKLDFGFIDGWHTFDHTLLDFFYINRMLTPGGVVIIDDVQMPAVNRAARYIYNYPAYEYIGGVTNEMITSKRKIFESSTKLLSGLKYVVGDKIAKEIFSSKLLKSDKTLNLECSMIAFKKIAEDTREGNWYENF
jgi:predicted O-methyltransferase YrrM